MKAYKLVIVSETIAGAIFNMADAVEQIILNSPSSGSSTEQIIKTCSLYNNFKGEVEKNKQYKSWTWWLSETDMETLRSQLDTMRWAAMPGELRNFVVKNVITAIKDAKLEEVPTS